MANMYTVRPGIFYKKKHITPFIVLHLHLQRCTDDKSSKNVKNKSTESFLNIFQQK